MPKMPGWLLPLTIISIAIALIPPALITRARTTKSKSPRINLIPDMDYQPKFLPQAENAMFADGRAMRLPVEGTVARGELREDTAVHAGRSATGGWVTSFPVPVTREMMERGRERYGISCAPCHGLDGAGAGMVNERALELAEQGKANWVPALSLHDDSVREREAGHIFNTITYGIRTMPAYGSQITTEDRWAIVAYVRALQRSTRATLRDVPEDRRAELQ